MFREGHSPKKEIVNIVFNHNGAGDMIASMTAIKYLRDYYPHVQINLIVPDFFYDLACNLVPNIEIHKFSEGTKVAYFDKSIIKTSECRYDTLKSHLVDNAFASICNKQITDNSLKNYCKLNLDNINIEKFNLPKKYVVITTGFTAEVRELLPHTTNELAQYIIKKGYVPVFLGKKNASLGLEGRTNLKGNFKNEIDYSVGIDLIDNTSLPEAGKIINGAKSIVGLDNGLLHLAATTSCPIVYGFTSVAPETRLPYRCNILGYNCYPVTPDESLACRYCQTNWDYFYSHNFTKCWYKENGQDTEIKCVKNLNSLKFIEQLEKIL